MSALSKLLADTFSVDESDIVDSLKMSDVENWNSLTHIELIVGIEDLSGVQLTQDDVAEMTSVGAIRAVLRRHGFAAD